MTPEELELVWKAIDRVNGRLDTLNGRLWAIVFGTCGTAVVSLLGLIFK